MAFRNDSEGSKPSQSSELPWRAASYATYDGKPSFKKSRPVMGKTGSQVTNYQHLRPRKHTLMQSLAFANVNEEATGTSSLAGELGPQNCSTIAWLINMKAFKIGMNLIIVLNAVQLGLSVDITGPGWADAWLACDHAFTAIFAIEMVMMLSVLRSDYFKDNWLLLDFAVVIISMLDAWIFPAMGVSQNIGFFRQFRLLRLLRIAKLTKVVPELAVVVEGLLNSMRSLFWIFVLLCVFLYAGAICCVEVIGNKDAGYPSFNEIQGDINDELVQNFNNYIYYGSIYRSMFTLFGIALLSEWPLIRPVMELHSAMVPFFILLVCIVAFGVLNVIIGIVVEKTMEAMQEFREEAQAQAKEEKIIAAEHIADLMFDIDTDGDGRISHEEMEASLRNGKMIHWMKRLDLPYNFSAAEFIHMLDVDGNGSLSKDEFVGGLFRLVYCSEFQRSCLHQMAIGAFHNSMHQVSLTLKRDLREAINEISQEVRMTLKGSWEPLEPRLGFHPQQIPEKLQQLPEKRVGGYWFPEKQVGVVPDIGESANTGAPQRPNDKALDIQIPTVAAPGTPISSNDGIRTSFPNSLSGNSRFHEPDIVAVTAETNTSQVGKGDSLNPNLYVNQEYDGRHFELSI